MKKIAVILIIISVIFSLFAESIEDTEDTENYFLFTNTLISENGKLIFSPNVGYYFSDDSGKSFNFRYSPVDKYTINQENEESFWAYLMKGEQLSLAGIIPLIYDETTSNSLLVISPRMSLSFKDFSFNSFNSLELQGYIPCKKEGFVIETEVEDYYSIDTINQGKRLNFLTNFNFANSLVNNTNSKMYSVNAQLEHDLGENLSDNWLYMNSIISNFSFSYNQRINENDDERISKSNSCSIDEAFSLIYDSKDNYSITLETGFNFSIKGEDFSTFFNSKDFNFYTDLNYKQIVDALTYELLGNFEMTNSWNLYNDNNYQYDATYSLELNGNLSYEISEGLDILSSCTLEYANSNYNIYHNIELEENLSYEISEILDTYIAYRIRKAFHAEESETSQSLVFSVNAEITDKFYFGVSTGWIDFESFNISASLKLNI